MQDKAAGQSSSTTAHPITALSKTTPFRHSQPCAKPVHSSSILKASALFMSNIIRAYPVRIFFSYLVFCFHLLRLLLVIMTEEFKTYTGGCHCQAVKFYVKYKPLEDAGVTACNCRYFMLFLSSSLSCLARGK